METVWRVLTRKKVLDPVSTEQSELGRVLNTLDLTALGVGSTLGVGVYVLVGHVAKDIAGPAVNLSFLIATVASVFAGLCYAEFGARAPRAGSAYIYSYVCVGEFVAFVIGWNLILEYVIGSASVARGLSLYLDALINNTLKDTFIDIAPIPNVPFMSAYFDFFAFGVSVLLAVALAFGLKESSWANNVFTLLNLLVVAIVIIAGGIEAKASNWSIDVGNRTDIGDGGFFPFGVEGMIKGAATCFYGFVGFDCIATTGEEVKNPKRAIPLAIIVSLSIIFLAYFGTSTVVTLMVPYFQQDRDAPLPYAFETVGLDWAKWVVTIGGIFGLCASLFGAMFPLPRIIYAMASDSIIFQFLGRVSSRFHTPVVGTLVAGLFTGLMAALFELKQLVSMMSIGTLMAYTIVAASVLLLRYEAEKGAPLIRSLSDSEESATYSESEALENGGTTEDSDLIADEFTCANFFKQMFNCRRRQGPSDVSEKIVKVEVFVYCTLCVLLGLCARFLSAPIGRGEIWAIVLTAVVVALALLVVMSMTTQPKSRKELSFKVPLVPLIPALSILINIYLMLMLDSNTWIRFAVWMLVGIPTYYFSVKTHPDARNESIYSSSDPSISKDGKLNGYANQSFVEDEEDAVENQQRKRPAPPPPVLNVDATIADFDQMLEKEEANIDNDRKFSVDSLSTASNVLCEENVQADVHCSDIPLTPTKDESPLVQSGDCVSNHPDSHPAEVADFANPEVEDSPETEQIDVSVTPVPETEPIEARIEETEPSVAENQPVPQTEPIEATIEETEPSVAENQPVPQTDPIIDNDFAVSETEPVIDSVEETDGNLKVDESEISKEELVPEETPAIPPPPPPLLVEAERVDISRPQVHANALSQVKLRPIQERRPPSTPPIDYSRQSSTVPRNDDNIKFGTPEYKEFLTQLGQKLQEGYVPAVKEPAKKPMVPLVDPDAIHRDVIEDKIDRDVAKQMFVQFLERTNSLPYFPVRNANSRENHEAKETRPVDLSEYKEKHRQNMENIFRSVRLRKEDSFKQPQSGDTGPKIDDDPADEILPTENKDSGDRQRHQDNMNGIFKSIRLRKVDSFKTNESQ